MKVLWDETVGIIDNGANSCCLGTTFRKTTILKYVNRPRSYMSSGTISSNLMQVVTIVLDYLGNMMYVRICIGSSSGQERESLLVEKKLTRTGFSLGFNQTEERLCTTKFVFTLSIYWYRRV